MPRRLNRFWAVRFCLALSLLLWPAAVTPQEASAPPQLTVAEKEEFLLKGKFISERTVPVGITRPLQASMEYNGLRHDAHVQTINERKTSLQTAIRTEFNFRDYFGFNVVAYEIDRLLALGMSPPCVARSYKGREAAICWWVDNVLMMEVDRMKKKIAPPDVDNWNQQMYAVRVVNQLIADTDPNLTNLLITRDWRIWTVDRTRAFRMQTKLENPKNLLAASGIGMCERRLLAKLRELDINVLRQRVGRYLTGPEADGLEGRRKVIVQFFDEQIAKHGEAAVLYDLPPRG